MDTIETKVIGGYQIDIFSDDDPVDPRMNDNLGTMVCFHIRYNLGDKHDFDKEEMMKIVKSPKNIVLPLYLYDHSGITMNTTGFSCSWDSGLVGWIFVEKSKIRSEFGWKRITQKREKEIRKYLEDEVKEYDQYLTGDVYGYRITNSITEEEIDSSCGHYGVNNCIKEAESVVNQFITEDESKP